MPPPLAAHSLRVVINQILRTDADLDAFCHDHFPEVYREFARGHTRTEKVNLLFAKSELEEISKVLYGKHQKAIDKFLTEKSPDESSRPAAQSHTKKALMAAGAAVGFCCALAYFVFYRPSNEIRETTKDLSYVDRKVIVDLGSSAKPDLTAPPVKTVAFTILTSDHDKTLVTLKAPSKSPEEFAMQAALLGEHAELFSHKTLDFKRREWITHTILLDKRTRRPIVMMIYPESRFKSWMSDPASISNTLREIVVITEEYLRTVESYRVPAVQLAISLSERDLNMAQTYYNNGLYHQSIQLAGTVLSNNPTDPRLQTRTWALIGRSACKMKNRDLAAKAVIEVGHHDFGTREQLIKSCQLLGLQWKGSLFQ